MAIATSYNVTSVQGSREDLSNNLRRVQPEQHPLYATLNQSAAPKALFHEWLNDDLPLPEYDSPLPDGADLSFNADFTNEIANRVRLGNRVQQFQRQAAVSPISEMVDIAGPDASLLAASKARTLITLKTDIESAIGSGQVPTVGTNTVGDRMGGLFHFSDPDATNGVFDTAAKRNFRSIGAGVTHNGTGVSSRFDQATGSLTEAKLNKVLQSIYEGGGKSQTYRLFAGPNLMSSLTSFSRAVNATGGAQSQFQADIKGGTLRLSIVEYVADWGVLQIVPDLFLNRTSGAGLSASSRRAGILIPSDDTVSLKVLQPVTVQDLPDVGGGGERFLTRTILTLCVLNSRAIGSII